MADIAEIIRRADAETAAGRAWRAKEILNGNIRRFSYGKWAETPELLELYIQYGKLLVRLGDVVEGGKYLFLSGTEDEQAGESVDLFISRHAAKKPGQIYSAFPASARLEKTELYPPRTAAALRKLGVPSPRKHELPAHSNVKNDTPHSPWRSLLIGQLFLAALIVPWLVGAGWLLFKLFTLIFG